MLRLRLRGVGSTSALAVLVSLGGCFNPEDGPSEAMETEGVSSSTSGNDTVNTPTTSAVSTTANPLPSTTADPSDSDSSSSTTTAVDTDDPPETTGPGDSSGQPVEPGCGDGIAVATEFCLDEPPVTYIVTRFPTDIAVGDVTSDGGLDIVTISQGVAADDGRIDVLEADGVGGFVSNAARPAPSYGARVRLVDTDNDNDLDIVSLGSEIRMLRNQGGFFANVSVASLFSNSWEVSELHVEDFDGDGIVDVATTEAYSQVVMMGSVVGGVWELDDGTAFPSPGEGASGIIAGALSWDNDDGIDAITLNQYYSDGVLFANDGDANFSEIGSAEICPGNVGIRFGELADLNGDGDSDIVVTCGQGDLSVVLGDAARGFGAPTILPLAGTHRLDVIDIDADGDLDLLVGSSTLERAVIFLNDGDALFELSERQFAAPGQVYATEVADLNDDGALDVVVGSDNGSEGRIDVYMANP